MYLPLWQSIWAWYAAAPLPGERIAKWKSLEECGISFQKFWFNHNLSQTGTSRDGQCGNCKKVCELLLNPSTYNAPQKYKPAPNVKLPLGSLNFCPGIQPSTVHCNSEWTHPLQHEGIGSQKSDEIISKSKFLCKYPKTCINSFEFWWFLFGIGVKRREKLYFDPED